MKNTIWLIVPYVAWMILMTCLPSTPAAYACRTVVTAVLLTVVAGLFGWRPKRPAGRDWLNLTTGLLVSLAVFVIWIVPEQLDLPWYRKLFIVGEGGTAAVDESGPVLLAMRLIGSAFVISVAEELFFRKWLIGFAGFWGMVFLFAIEHDRWLVGAIAGIVYGLLYLRRGLFAAIVAHAFTNLVLGIWVLKTGQWQFW